MNERAPPPGGIFYHGGDDVIDRIDPAQVGADGELLCASASANVARRYGPVVTAFALSSEHVIHTSVRDWFAGAGPAAAPIGELRQRTPPVHAIIVAGDPDWFDFPADTIFVVVPEALRTLGQVDPQRLVALDDGWSTSHTPVGPAARDWAAFVASLHDGDETEALAEVEDAARQSRAPGP